MKKSLVCLALVALLAVSGATVLAAANKVALGPYAPNGPLEPDAYGQTVLNYAKGADATEVQVNCWGLMPEATYTVYLYAPSGFHSIGDFTTRRNGSGNLHVRLEGDHSDHTPVAVNNGDNLTVLLGE